MMRFNIVFFCFRFTIMNSCKDVIVKWKDGSQNCVRIKELKTVTKGDKIDRVGTEVKMFYKRRWFFGTVLMTENDDSQNIMSQKSSDDDTDYSTDDEPLLNLAKRRNFLSSEGDENEDPFCNVDLEEPDDPDFVLPLSTQRNDSPVSDVTICIDDLVRDCAIANNTMQPLESVNLLYQLFHK